MTIRYKLLDDDKVIIIKEIDTVTSNGALVTFIGKDKRLVLETEKIDFIRFKRSRK